MSRRRTLAVAVAIVAALAMTATRAGAYLKLGFDFNGDIVSLKWSRVPVSWRVYPVSVPGVSVSDFQSALGRAFDRWEAVPTSAMAYRYDGFAANPPGVDDGITTLGFQSRPELERVLASTSFLVDGFTGDLIESDIFFNAAFAWSTANGGESGRFDVESIAVHEIGHLSGLGHSLLGETELSGAGRRVIGAASVMFPIAFSAGSVAARTLMPDDVAGISDIYPAAGFDRHTGSVSGRITRNGGGVFGAHIAALHLATGSLVGNFSLTSGGQFSIAGLQPGPHVLRVEPLDDAEVESFFDSDSVGLDFRATYLPRLIVVPRGGDSGAVEIQVTPR